MISCDTIHGNSTGKARLLPSRVETTLLQRVPEHLTPVTTDDHTRKKKIAQRPGPAQSKQEAVWATGLAISAIAGCEHTEQEGKGQLHGF